MMKRRNWTRRGVLTGAAAVCAVAPLSSLARAATAQESATGTYNEPYRPAYHFSPPKAWMNDPNGLVYYKGTYHLFYQHYPHDNVWGPMHWGHAVSKDMLHWVDKPIALAPDAQGFIFSGSAVVDWNNTSGLGTGNNPPLVAIFTYHDDNYKQAGLAEHQNQGMAYSTDGGKTWKKYEKNPVLLAPAGKPNFRDPKVRWNEGTTSWIMTLAVGDHIEIYGSADLKNWHYLSQFGSGIGAHGGVWECPDLLPMKLAKTGETKWVLLLSINPGGPNGGSATQYFVGDFDGKEFKLDAEYTRQLRSRGPQWLDWGADNYAGVTWSDVPKADGRVLMIGWMNNWDYALNVPTTVWRGAMTLPRELTLYKDELGYCLRSLPAAEVKKLRGKSYSVKPEIVADRRPAPVPSEVVMQSEIEVAFVRPPQGTKAYMEFSNAKGDVYQIGYDGESGGYFSDRRKSGLTDFSDKFANAVHTAPRNAQSDIVKMRIFMDHGSVELFADEGATAMTESVFPREPYTTVAFKVDGKPVKVAKFRLTQLKSIH